MAYDIKIGNNILSRSVNNANSAYGIALNGVKKTLAGVKEIEREWSGNLLWKDATKYENTKLFIRFSADSNFSHSYYTPNSNGFTKCTYRLIRDVQKKGNYGVYANGVYIADGNLILPLQKTMAGVFKYTKKGEFEHHNEAYLSLAGWYSLSLFTQVGSSVDYDSVSAYIKNNSLYVEGDNYDNTYYAKYVTGTASYLTF